MLLFNVLHNSVLGYKKSDKRKNISNYVTDSYKINENEKTM